MLSTTSRQRAEASIRRAVSQDVGPWAALDAYRHRGGRIRWDDWFQLWKQIAQTAAPYGEHHPTRLFAGHASQQRS
jgi:extradiol dioxygenase family protein